MTFYYRSHVGMMKIVPLRDGRWALCINDEALGSYHSPDAAADDVYTQNTGHFGWDSGPIPMTPLDLSDWERG